MQKYFAILLSFALMFAWYQSIDAKEDETTILWYKFDVAFKDEIQDRSPHENHGQINGKVKFERDGKVGGAASFIVGNKITVPISDSLNVEKDLTIEFWIKPDKVPASTYWRLIHKGWVQNGSFICGIDNNWMALGYTWDIKNMAGVRKDANKPNAVVGETWQYYSATYDGKNIILYVDGEPLIQTPAEGKINGVFDIIIAESFSGMLDEIRFSNVVLSKEEIQKHMEGKELHAVDAEGKLTITWAEVKSKR
ncbi:LamG domain-containing protein [bacterium]|nr:LamG domain-containing protein [bacterium]